ncbi:MAG: DNA repair protein RecO [Clostridiales bacterium]|nr:DNA repair protein RecO [Clostridiales bacterium]
MVQTENTAIVLRYVNYREQDRIVTLFSPSRGRIDAVIRNCRKPKSHNLNSGELFALGDYMLVETGGRVTVTSVHLIETFYALRQDYGRLTCGTYLLSLTEAVIEPEQERQELFMLLLHTLSRLAFSDQPWRPLLAGFLLHFSACEGFKPRLNHCVMCGRRMEEEPFFFDMEEGGLCCGDCHEKRTRMTRPGEEKQEALSPQQVRWMREALGKGSAGWVDSPESCAPFGLLRKYTERRLGRRIRSAALLPE